MPADFQTAKFTVSAGHFRNGDSEFFQRHSISSSTGARAIRWERPQNLLGQGAGGRGRGLVIPAPGCGPQHGEFAAAQLDDDLLHRLEAQPLDVFQQHALPAVMIPGNSRGE